MIRVNIIYSLFNILKNICPDFLSQTIFLSVVWVVFESIKLIMSR